MQCNCGAQDRPEHRPHDKGCSVFVDDAPAAKGNAQMKIEITVQNYLCHGACKEADEAIFVSSPGRRDATFNHNDETGEPQLTCVGCGTASVMKKQERLELLNRLNRASNTLSRHC